MGDDAQRLDVSLFLWHFNQCDPARCSGKKLLRRKLAVELRRGEPFEGVVLYDDTPDMLSLADLATAEASGIAAIDCSWNKIGKLNFATLVRKAKLRKLPFLLAANPCHFGRPLQLNCVEAFAAALVLLQREAAAQQLLAIFSWGASFSSLNRKLLDLYCARPYSAASLEKLSAKAQQKHKEKKLKLIG